MSLLTFLSPAAFEQRARDRERRALTAEMVHIVERQRFIHARAAELDRADSDAQLAAMRARVVPCCDEPVRLVHGTVPPGMNFVFASGDPDPLGSAPAGRRFFAVTP